MSPITRKTRYWRSLDEFFDRPEHRATIEREFPVAASQLGEDVSRRRWLQVMGASLAFAGVGCRWEAEKIVPMVQRPANRVPGEPQKFSTSWELNGFARPITVTSIDGRPIKIEGNRQHPQSRGGTSSFDQALILGLYDPDRRDGISSIENNQTFRRDWNEFDKWLDQQIMKSVDNPSKKIAIITQPSSSPTRLRLKKALLDKFPNLVWTEVSSLDDGQGQAGAAIAYGRPLLKKLRIDRARVIVSFCDDLFGNVQNDVAYIRDWSEHRSPEKGWMNRLYVAESEFSLTGANADHRLALKPSEMPALVGEIIAAVESENDLLPVGTKRQKFVAAIADDLRKFPGRSIISAGESLPAEVHAAIFRLNERLGNVGRTIELREVSSDSTAYVHELCESLHRGDVETVLILGGNPSYQIPTRLRFDAGLRRARHVVHLGLYDDESSQLADWKLPQAHPLESWGDFLSTDGTLATAQPLIAPLFDGRSEIQVLSAMLGESSDAQAIVKETFLTGQDGADEMTWREAIHDGFRQSTTPAIGVSLIDESTFEPLAASEGRNGIELIFRLSEQTFDGEFANNGWMQETPATLTKLTWDNAALISPRTADKLKVKQSQLIEIRRGQAKIQIPVYIMPGQAEDTICLTLGYGRTHAGVIGGDLDNGVAPVGVNVNVLRQSLDEHAITDGVEVQALSKSVELATTQDHFAIDRLGLEEIAGRVDELVREGTLVEYEAHPEFAKGHRNHPAYDSLWEEREYNDHAWGMAIDLSRCVGCNACLVACQSENNVPLVGKEQVLAGREMHWIRTDRYFHGDLEDPDVAHQPVACHHCENAPCEQVCPVAASVHSDEGLNDMIYNRCVGTRYCANNCPYKVRRFNFFDFNAEYSEPGNELQQLVLNPEVTVRSRGVMEKCTYCVQRIQGAKIEAKVDRRPVQDGDVVTACQESCPAQAIVFGDLNDSKSAVAKAHQNNRAYGMLEELNVKPRTKYLAKIRNPHPYFDEGTGHSDAHVHATAVESSTSKGAV